MAGSTFQPPIPINPEQGNAEQISFINQNFQTLASTLETNSLRLVDDGTTTMVNDGTSTASWTTIPHNLGFAPIPFAFLTGTTVSFGSSVLTNNGNIPLPTYISLFIDTVNKVIDFTSYMNVLADDTNVYIIIFNSSGATTGNLVVSYYLTQKSAEG